MGFFGKFLKSWGRFSVLPGVVAPPDTLILLGDKITVLLGEKKIMPYGSDFGFKELAEGRASLRMPEGFLLPARQRPQGASGRPGERPPSDQTRRVPSGRFSFG